MSELKVSTAGLNDRQARFVEAYISSGSIRDSAVVAGYSHPEAGYTVLRSKSVQAALHEGRERVLKTDLAGEAIRTMRDLMKPGVPPSTRFAAAKWVAEAAGHGAKADASQGKKPISEMTTAELADFIKRMDQVIEGEFTELGPDSAQDRGTTSPPALPEPAEDSDA